MARVKAASFEDRLTLVEHLDELRSRLIFCAVALVVVTIGCFVFNHVLIDIANGPLPDDIEPVTFSPSEPFLTTLTLTFYSAILITLPILIYQAYAFILPALTPREKKVTLPILLLIPVLFILGVVFAYFVVVPAAIKFLLNFNSDQFNIQIRAREYYSFFSLSLLSVGILFQIPIGILAVTRLGHHHPEPARRQPSLRDPHHRDPGDAAARHRSDHDAAVDAAADPALRVQPDPRQIPRSRDSRGDRRQARRSRPPGRIDRLGSPACSSNSAASASV